MRIEPGPIARRAKITRGNELPDEKGLVTSPLQAQSEVGTSVQSQLETRMLLRLKFLRDIWSRCSDLDKWQLGVLGQLLRIIVACRVCS